MRKSSIGRDTTLCISLAGRPGTFGSRFHNRLYEALELDYVYKAFTTTDLPAAIGGIRALGIRGCAISMPFKEEVIPLLDGLEASAAAIDSVNTIVNEAGRLTGYNTDYSAILSLIERKEVDRRVPFLLRGSGGMAKAVAAALRDAGFVNGTIVARNPVDGPGLAESCGFEWAPDLGELVAPLLVNATPLGMAGADEGALAFPDQCIEGCEIAFDVVALPAETPFLMAARARGKRVIDGAEVAMLQALEQFILYTGVRPSAALVAEAGIYARDTTRV